jgi:hypothetical protein
MAKKSFLLGLGIGLLLATITLQFDFWNSNQQLNNPVMTIEKLKDEAKKAGYELKTKREIELEMNQAVEKYKNEQKQKTEKSNETSKLTPNSKATPNTKSAQKSQKPSTNINAAGANSVDPSAITIQSGWDATEVANYLHKKGVVKDKKALLRALVGLSKTRKISARTFKLEKNSDPEEIARKITVGN